MADIVVLNDLGGNSYSYHRRLGPFWASSLIGYVIYEDGASPGLVRYRKTTDGGQTWAAAVTIISTLAGQVKCLGLWYDKWTPGDTGTKVHIVVGRNSVTLAIRYLTFDIATEAISSAVVVKGSMTPLGTGTVNIVKARNGNLYIGGWSGDLFIGFYRSADSGATWASRSTTAFTTSWTSQKQFDMHPGLEADQADIWLVCRQNLTNNVVLWVYDDSANSWSSTVIVASTASLDKQLATCTRLSDGHVIVICATIAWDSSQAFKCYDIASSASITAKTSPMTAQYVLSLGVMANQVDGVLWLAYGRGTTGGTDVKVYYRTSTDGGASWSAETPYSVSAYDNRGVWVQPSVPATTTGRFYPLLDDVIGSTNLYGNYDNSVLAAPPPSAALSGTLLATPTMVAVQAGGKTIDLTLTGTTWDAAIGQDNSQTQALLNGIVSATGQAAGWNALVSPAMNYTHVVRVSSTLVRITLPAVPLFYIVADETITATVPAVAVAAAVEIVAAPSIVLTSLVVLQKVRVAGLRHVYRSGSYREEITIGDVIGAVELAQRQFIDPNLAPVEPEPVKRPSAAPAPVSAPTAKLPFSAPGPLMEEPPSRPVAVPTPVDAGMWRPRTFVEYLQTYTGKKPLIQQVPKVVEAGKNIAQKVWGWVRKTVPGLRQ